MKKAKKRKRIPHLRDIDTFGTVSSLFDLYPKSMKFLFHKSLYGNILKSHCCVDAMRNPRLIITYCQYSHDFPPMAMCRFHRQVYLDIVKALPNKLYKKVSKHDWKSQTKIYESLSL